MRHGLLVAAVPALAAATLAGVARAPARPGDGRCDGSRPSPAAEAIAATQSLRRQLGLPSSRAHVVALRHSARARRRGAALESFPVNAREARYMRERNRVEDRADRAGTYLRRHAAATSGGLSIEDDWPRRPYLGVRLTRDLARHARALDARLDVEVRVIRVRRSLRALRRIQARVDAASDGLRATGIAVVATAPDIRRNRVDVEVITARRDAPAVLARRFGAVVHVTVVATRPDRLVCVPVGSYTPAADGRSLVVRYASSPSSRFERPFVAETAATVRAGVIERRPTGPVLDQAVERTAVIPLAAPLGARTVVDAETGAPLPRVP
jgi:hypothetical protein